MPTKPKHPILKPTLPLRTERPLSCRGRITRRSYNIRVGSPDPLLPLSPNPNYQHHRHTKHRSLEKRMMTYIQFLEMKLIATMKNQLGSKLYTYNT